MKCAFDRDYYLDIQRAEIRKRVLLFDNKLYLEFGGKLFEDKHASRVLPGFKPNSKLEMFSGLKDQIEVVITVNAHDIANNKIRYDSDLSYQDEIGRIIDAFRAKNILVSSVVFSFYFSHPLVNAFKRKLERNGIKTYRHYHIEGYPHNIPLILSERGFGKNEYIETTRPIVVFTAPGPGSGKLSACLSQLYQDSKKGVRSGYAKYETFPIWNLPLNHPLNLAYEAATVDLGDFLVIDQYHKDEFGVEATNYNRDIEAFPLLKLIFEKIYGVSPYQSPTMMGVNMVGFAIRNEEICIQAAKEEIIRRYFQAKKNNFYDKYDDQSVVRVRQLLESLNLSETDRLPVQPALEKAKKTGVPCMALSFKNGEIVTAKTSSLLSAPAALFLNAVKHLAGINDEIPLISKQVIIPIMDLHKKLNPSDTPIFSLTETLTSLAIQAPTNPLSELALKQISKLKGAQAHSSVILAKAERSLLKKLGIDVTEESVAGTDKLFRR
ncbi:MAG: DUF1846 domain-containing protein [Bacilli bacterium]|jgi:uncharacterized protein (UPF0371 family)